MLSWSPFTECKFLQCMMAKFVVSGRVDCAAYARAEMLADQLKARLPDFHVHKIAVPSEEWGGWVREECDRRGWEGHSGEVLVWRELVKRGGRGLYLGGVRELEEYASHYHNITPHTDTATEERIAVENRQSLEADRMEVESREKPRPLKVAVTASSSPLAYHLLHLLAEGAVFGSQLISLYLLDTPTHANELLGVAMEIIDMASPTVYSVQCTSSLQEAFQSASVIFILDYHEKEKEGERDEGEKEGEIDEGGKKREKEEERDEGEEGETDEGGKEGEKEGERDEGEEGETDEGEKVGKKEEERDEGKEGETDEGGKEGERDGEKEGERDEGSKKDEGDRSDLATAVSLYYKYGATLDFCAQKDVRVIVAGRYTNVGAAIISRSAPSLPASHIIGAPCLAAQRAKSAIACKLGLNTADIEQVCVWGRCGGDNVVVDTSAARVRHYPGAIVGPDPFSLPLSQCVFDPEWLTSGVAEESRRRGRMVKGGGGGVMSEAVAIANMVHQWSVSQDTKTDNRGGTWCPVGVVSDGNCYGFPKGVVCSAPVRSEGGEWKVVPDLHLTPTIQSQLALQRDSLSQELEMAWKHVQSNTN